MKTRCPSILLCLFAASISYSVSAKEKLPAPDLQAIHTQISAHQHAFQQQSQDRFTARNPGLRWSLEFDGRGFLAHPDGASWAWGLELDSAEWPVSGDVAASGHRLSIPRGQQMEEWFVNDTRGLEQGWTLRSRPHQMSADKLRLSLHVRGGLLARGSGASVQFEDETGAVMLEYGGLKAWDAAGKTLPARLQAFGRQLVVEVDDHAAVYPITIDPVAQTAYLKASNPQEDDAFGYSVFVSGTTVVVGALGEDSDSDVINGNQADNSAPEAGAAYVFVRNGVQWEMQAYLKASNSDSSDNFGRVVAISGDTIVIATRNEDSNATGVNGNQADNSASDAGVAYVYVRTGSVWTQQAYLKASNTEAGDQFGRSVAIDGDTIVVGAMQEDSSAMGVNGNQADNTSTDSGAAYVFTRSGTVWTQQAYLKASNTNPGDAFGGSVAVRGDTVAIGASAEDSDGVGLNQLNNSASDAGAVYIFTRSGIVWSQQAYLKASNAGTSDNFGVSISLWADTLVVGAWLEQSNATGVNGNGADNSADASGAAYVFFRSGVVWSQQAYLKASNSAPGDEFGLSVGVFEDWVVVGATAEASSATGVNGDQLSNKTAESGAAYLFQRTGSQWAQIAYLKASNTGVDDWFGRSVSVADDIVVVAARVEASASNVVNGNEADNSARAAGATYVFELPWSVNGLAHSGYRAPGVVDLFHGAQGLSAISAAGKVLFEEAVIGTGAAKGKNRAIFSTLAPSGEVELLLQKGDTNSSATSWPAGGKASSFVSPMINQSPGLFQTLVTGSGISASNNRLLMSDDGNVLSILRRTGTPVAELAGALTKSFVDVAQHTTLDALGVSYLLQPNPSLGVTPTTDSGLLILKHDGSVQGATAREGGTAFGGGGDFGAFSGRAAARLGTNCAFIAKFIPTGEAARDAVFHTNADNSSTGRYASAQGDLAPGTINGEKLGTFLAVSEWNGRGLFKASLTGAPGSSNEGLWSAVSGLVLRKGDNIGGGLTVTKILRFWPVQNDQVIIHVMLAGSGVSSSSNQALILKQNTNGYLVLIRTGLPAPGAGTATLGAIGAVDVDPEQGFYTVLGALKGTSSAKNQALWRGQTILGDDTTQQNQRKPVLVLRKGGIYRSAITPMGLIRGILLKPAADTTGAGARGLGRVINNLGETTLTIVGDKSSQELVIME
ncbi:MAG: FG-GAP repeat protein [Verrucomicrobiaceae bacterium]|nr:FG-GAP repeat protein [Verrucomicrobiaceae bacterium]